MCFTVGVTVFYWYLSELFLSSIAKNLQEFPVFAMDNISFSKYFHHLHAYQYC